MFIILFIFNFWIICPSFTFYFILTKLRKFEIKLVDHVILIIHEGKKEGELLSKVEGWETWQTVTSCCPQVFLFDDFQPYLKTYSLFMNDHVMLISVGKYCADSSSTPVVKAGNSLMSLVLFRTEESLSYKFKVCLGITWEV